MQPRLSGAASARMYRPSALERWARFSHRYRGRVIGAWFILAGALVALAANFGGAFNDNFTLPGSESQAGYDLLEARYPGQSGDAADLVFEAADGISSPAIRSRIEGLLAEVATLPGVAGVDSPFDDPSHISPDGTIARASVRWEVRAAEADTEEVQALVDAADAANGAGLRVEAGGQLVARTEQPELSSEAIGLLAAVVILFFAFGSLVAMGLPIFSALFGIAAAVAVVTLGARFIDFPDFAGQFIAMIGIGVGIDYCLLVVTRFREGLHAGRTVEAAVVLAVTTAGRSVIFAGIVVAIAFFGLYAMGLPFIAALGTATALAVILAVIVATTLLPATLSLIGRKVDALRVPMLHTTEGVDVTSTWYRLAVRIQRRPLPYALGSAAILLIAAIPLLSMELGFTDAGNQPPSTHTRRAYDLLSKGFGAGFNGPVLVVLDLAGGGADRIDALRDAIVQTPNVAAVDAAIQNPAGDAAMVRIYPGSKPQAGETTDLVHALRETVIPGALDGSGARAYVAGGVATQIDVQDRIGARLPLLFIGVIGLSFILLMAVFRSVAVALKAAIMNLLSIGAAYGAVVAIFQWGWGADLIGVSPGPIEVFLPMMFFTILFGLSMDYEVFLISRIREVYLHTGDTGTAVAHGLAATARVITAAAAIMVAVFLAFVLGDDRVIKEVGIGLATAIFVDATIVRLFLVPATMALLGRWNWWLPAWLDRILPELHVEGSRHPAAEQPEPAGAPAGGQ